MGISKWGTYLSTLIVARKRRLLNERDMDIAKTAKTLREVYVVNLEELDQRLLDRFEEVKKSKGETVDETLLSKASSELELWTSDIKKELLKKVNKEIAKELTIQPSLKK